MHVQLAAMTRAQRREVPFGEHAGETPPAACAHRPSAACAPLPGLKRSRGSSASLIVRMSADRRLAVLLDEEARLAVADAVLAGARPAAGERAAHDAVVELLGGDSSSGRSGSRHDRDVEVAVADVTDDRRLQAVLGDVRLRLERRSPQARRSGTQTSVVSTSQPGCVAFVAS